MYERPDTTHGVTRRVKTGCGSLYITMNLDVDGNLVEVFVTLGKGGGCASSGAEALGRLTTLALRGGVPVDKIVHHLVGIQCNAPVGFGPNRVNSCADAVAQALKQHIEKEKKNR